MLQNALTPRRFRLIPLLSLLAAASGAQAQSPAQASSPYYIGVTQAFTHESNVQQRPAGQEVGDTYSTTTLRGGFDQPIGRQRVYAGASVSRAQYQDLDQLNNTGYGLNAGLDWSTIGNLSGTLTALADRRLARFDTGVATVTQRNEQTQSELGATLRYGLASRLSLEAGGAHRQVSFSAIEFQPLEYKQTSGRFGVNYRVSGALGLGTGVSASDTTYSAPLPGQPSNDGSRREDVYVTANWIPTGASTLDARINFGKTKYDIVTANNYSGATGLISWIYKPTGRLEFTTRLSRDTGQETGAIRTTAAGIAATTDFSRITDVVSLHATYELSAKILVDAGGDYSKRRLVNPTTGAGGSDNIRTATVGLRWMPTRSLAFGLSGGKESRRGGPLSYSYGNNKVNLYGQFTLQ